MTVVAIFQTVLTAVDVSSPIECDIWFCSRIKVNRRFGITCNTSDVEIFQQQKCLMLHVTPKRRLTLIRLQNHISQSIRLFTSTAVRTKHSGVLIDIQDVSKRAVQ
jgi:hypothetical protein